MLMGKHKGEIQQGKNPAGSLVHYPTRTKRRMKFSTRGWQKSHQLLALVLMGDINLPDICWKYNAAETKQSGRFLQ